MARKRLGYRLAVKPLSDDDFKCLLRAEPVVDSDAPSGRKSRLVSSLNGWRLDVAMGFIKRMLKEERYKPSRLNRSRKTPFQLDEQHGAKLDLVFRAIKDIQKRTKMEEIIYGIEGMSGEEALYWHSKLEQDFKRPEKRALKALRIMLGGE